MGSHPRSIQPGHKLGSPESPSKVLSKMTGHFLNSCALYTKVFVLHFFSPLKARERKNRKSPGSGIILLRHLLSPLPVSCKQPLIQQGSVKSLVAMPRWGYLGWSNSWMSWYVAMQNPDSPPLSQRALSALSSPHCRSWHLSGLPFSRHRLPQAQKVVHFILILKQ